MYYNADLQGSSEYLGDTRRSLVPRLFNSLKNIEVTFLTFFMLYLLHKYHRSNIVFCFSPPPNPLHEWRGDLGGL